MVSIYRNIYFSASKGTPRTRNHCLYPVLLPDIMAYTDHLSLNEKGFIFPRVIDYVIEQDICERCQNFIIPNPSIMLVSWK